VAAGAAGAGVDGVGQVLQFCSVPSWVSQLRSSMLQSAQSGSQRSTAQLPSAQVGLALAIAQAMPQRPQWVRVLSRVSQPSRYSPSQSS
jgi:hypothetical protein